MGKHQVRSGVIISIGNYLRHNCGRRAHTRSTCGHGSTLVADDVVGVEADSHGRTLVAVVGVEADMGEWRVSSWVVVIIGLT